MKHCVRFLLSLLLVAPLAWADEEALSKLNQQLYNLKSVSASFEQWTVDPSGARLQESTGEIRVKRPHLFRWEVKTPFPQLILADGKIVQLYDPDLEQLMIQPMSDQLNLTPALLLSGQTERLAQNYDVSLSQSKGVDHFLLVPKNSDSLFEKLRLSFQRGEVVEMMLMDPFGSRTQIRFNQVRQNSAIDDALFELELPDGVDIIDERS